MRRGLARRLSITAALLGCARDEPTPDVVVPTPAIEPVTQAARPELAPPVAEPPVAVVAAPAAEPAAPPEPELPPGSHRGVVASGQSLSRIAASFGLGGAAIAELVAALTPVMDPATIREGTGWAAQLDDAGALQSFTLERSATTRIEVTRQAGGELVARTAELPTVVEQLAVSATIDSSLSAAIVGAGGDAGVVASVVEVFASDIDFYTDPRKGDRIALVVEQHELDGEVVAHGRVLAAAYHGDEVGDVRGLWWTPPGASAGSWYTPAGKSLDRTLLKSPLKYTRLSSGFNPKRMHPVLHKVKGHYGVDYAAPVGTPVWAAAGGEIVFRGEKGPAGNMVVLAHDGGFTTVYMHLSKFADAQKVGMRVAQKTVIGYVGTTGRSTGPHLHFGVKRSGRWVDPSLVRAIERPGVSAKQRARFERDTAELRTHIEALLADEPRHDDAAQPAADVPADTAATP